MTWESPEAAEAWARAAATRGGALGPATDLMLDLARILGGDTVLDVGTGTGDTARLVAGRVGAGGRVVAVDSSAAMVKTARAATAHLANVEVLVADAQRLDLAGPFGAAVSRNTLMLVDQPPAMLAEIQRVLRPGGRVAVTVWAQEPNPRFDLPAEAVEAAGGVLPDVTVLRTRRLGDPELLERLFAEAGFIEVEVHRVDASSVYSSPTGFAEELSTHPGVAELIDTLAAAARERARAWLAQAAAGRTHVPGAQLVAAGTRR